MTEDAAAKLAERLTELWRSSKSTVLERMLTLRSACERLTQEPSDADARTRGLEAAHKLSGVLGVFGLPQGSEIASSIEFLLETKGPLTAETLTALQRRVADLDAVIASKPDE